MGENSDNRRRYAPSHLAELEQMLPKADLAEMTVLGAVLVSPECAAFILDELADSDFGNEKHQRIFKAIQAGANAHEMPTYEALHAKLDGGLASIGGNSYLAELEAEVISTIPAALTGPIKRVKDAAQRRMIIRAMIEEAQRAVTIDESASDLASRVQERLAGIDSGDGADDDLSIFNIDELFALDLPEDDNIVADRAIALEEIALVVGQPGIGKSRAILQLAIDMALGRPWLGVLPIHRRDIQFLVLQTENSARRLRRDLRAQLQGASPEARQWFKEHFHFLVVLKPDDRDLCLDNPKTVARIRRAFLRFKPDLVIIDPYVDFFAGDCENDATQTRATLRILQKVCKSYSERTGIIIIHHSRTGKAAAAGAFGLDAAAYGRGSKALVGVARSQINISPGSTTDSSIVVISQAKSNNGRPFQPFAVRLNEQTMLYEAYPDFNMEAWQHEISGAAKIQGPLVTSESVVEALRNLGGTAKKSDLVKSIMEMTGAKKTAAYDAISRAVQKKAISEGEGQCVLC
ncbi:MAG: AAA family ATPase [Candidatus Sumerlaeota bacterium]|nr:AAA family ATPase [Candidatus Sumerlaeota bacterium]